MHTVTNFHILEIIISNSALSQSIGQGYEKKMLRTGICICILLKLHHILEMFFKSLMGPDLCTFVGALIKHITQNKH